VAEEQKWHVRRLTAPLSGIFGYINYLVEKDRKFILDTLVNGKQSSRQSSEGEIRLTDMLARPLPTRVQRLRLGWSRSRRRQEE